MDTQFSPIVCIQFKDICTKRRQNVPEPVDQKHFFVIKKIAETYKVFINVRRGLNDKVVNVICVHCVAFNQTSAKSIF